MSKLADAIRAELPNKGPACGVRVLLDTLPKDLKEDLTAALESRAVPSTSIARGLTNIGHRIGADAVGRHRKNDCACGRAR